MPKERLGASTALTNVVVDYLDFSTVKIGQRNKKRCCCLFKCLSMRAVHMEVVLKMDTDSCLNISMRFFVHEESNQVQSSARTGQTLLELKEKVQSTMGLGTKKGLKNI